MAERQAVVAKEGRGEYDVKCESRPLHVRKGEGIHEDR